MKRTYKLSVECGDEERFRRLFEDVYDSIPDEDFEKISNLLVCLDGVSDQWVQGSSGEALAQCGRSWVSFRAAAMDVMPDGAVRYHVAHELAHARLRVDDPMHIFAPDAEEQADALAARWGYRFVDYASMGVNASIFAREYAPRLVEIGVDVHVDGYMVTIEIEGRLKGEWSVEYLQDLLPYFDQIIDDPTDEDAMDVIVDELKWL